MALAYQLTADGDLSLSGGGPKLVSGSEALRGALYYRFSTFAGSSREDPGEWAYDYSYGVRWRGPVLGNFFTEDETRSMLADVATRTTGARPVASYQVSFTFDTNLRKTFITIVDIQAGNDTQGTTITVPSPQGSSL